MIFNKLKKHIHGNIPVIFVLCLFIYGTFFIVLHHHDDGRVKDNCPVCRLQLYGNNATAEGKQVLVALPCFDADPINILNEKFIKI